MTVIAIGIDHHSAPVEILGQLAIAADVLPKALVEMTTSPFVNEAVAVSTCNRTEIYVDAERFHDAYHDVRDALGIVTGTPIETFVDHVVVRYHDEAIQHLFNVTAGLDSAIVGEHEILGQVRSAWELAKDEGTSSAVLDPLFQHALSSGKRVRSETAIGRHTASLSHAAVSLIGQRRASLAGNRVLLVGTGEVGAGLAMAIGRSAPVDLRVANRTRSRAASLAADLADVGLRADVVEFAALPDEVAAADIVIAATAAPELLIDASHLEGAPPRSEAKLLLDLAVPADIDPALADHPACELLVLADLQEFANRGLELRLAEAEAARAIMGESIARYRKAISAREVDPLLGALHRWSDRVRADEIERYRSRLGQLDANQLEAVEAMTKAMMAKVLHRPSTELRGAAGTPRGERLAESARELFDLP